MQSKKFKIKEEKATILDIKSAVSIALFNGELNNKGIELDTDVRRAITYNKIIFEDLSKRLFSYYNSREDKKNKLKEISLVRALKKNPNLLNKERIYYIENPNLNTFEFLDDVLDKEKKVRGYSEYILFSLFNNYFDYIKINSFKYIRLN